MLNLSPLFSKSPCPSIHLQAACARLEHERQPKDRSGFRVSRRPMYGRPAYLLALQKPGSPGLFTICRPNTGKEVVRGEREGGQSVV